MKQKLRDGTMIQEQNGQDKLLGLLYGSVTGRLLLKPLTHPVISKLAGSFLSSGLSRPLIAPFVRKHHIDLQQFEQVTYRSYNEFFSRKILPKERPIDRDPCHLISPCDSKLTVLPITKDRILTLKHTDYTLQSLLRNTDLAAAYAGGYALIFRLTVDDYHRYCYVAEGEKSENVIIPGILHTVNPIANDYYTIYKENSREYSILSTKEFGEILMMEVGALLVGKIVNHHQKSHVSRGEEKGYFQFGGSTVILLFQENTVRIDPDLLENSSREIETVVRMGEKIGVTAQ